MQNRVVLIVMIALVKVDIVRNQKEICATKEHLEGIAAVLRRYLTIKFARDK